MHRFRSKTLSIRRSRHKRIRKDNTYEAIPGAEFNGFVRCSSLGTVKGNKGEADTPPPPLPPPRRHGSLRVSPSSIPRSNSMNLHLDRSSEQAVYNGSLSDGCSECSDFDFIPTSSGAYKCEVFDTRTSSVSTPPVIAINDQVSRDDQSCAHKTGNTPTSLCCEQDSSDYVFMESVGSSRWSLSQPGSDADDENRDRKSPSRTDELEAKLDHLATRLNTLTDLFEDKAPSPPSRMERNGSQRRSPEEIDSTTKENREFLSTLDCDQVLALLDSMKLSKYKDSFQQEQVSGEVLLECDDEVLEKELHVCIRIHRIRLMNIISGKTSARDRLNIN